MVANREAGVFLLRMSIWTWDPAKAAAPAQVTARDDPTGRRHGPSRSRGSGKSAALTRLMAEAREAAES